MRLDTGQHMRMDQRMKLSPRMIQSMEILQLSTLALEERIEQELEGNPVLELEENLAKKQTTDKNSETEKPMVVEDSSKSNEDDFARADEFSESYGEMYQQNTTESADYHIPSRKYRDSGDGDAKMEAMANAPSRSASLVDQLLDQWHLVELSDPILKAGEYVLEYVDDDGFIRTETDIIARNAPPNITPEQITEAWGMLKKRLDPPGICAVDMKECLLIQLDLLSRQETEEDEIDNIEIAIKLVEDHLKDIEMNHLPQIAKRTGMTMDQIKDGMLCLRRLDPRPGRQLAPERPQLIVPDVIVEYDSVNDTYVAALARGGQPALRINPSYRKLSKDRDQDTSTRQFLAQNMQSARWLIDSIDQRNNTLLRVVNVVIEAQREFLDHGPQHLKPLPMVQVADQLDVHVATISRAVSEKYLQTPRGIYALRMFFSGGTESASGEEMSWSAVQAKLKELIEHEDPKKPLSDEKLVDALSEQGIDIARRTVAKYRNQMNIPPARRRKKF